MRDGEGESRKRIKEWKMERVTVRERVFFHSEGKCYLINLCMCKIDAKCTCTRVLHLIRKRDNFKSCFLM